jgi:hypothetical protein
MTQTRATVEHERLEALHDTAILERPAEERLEHVVRLAKRIFGVPLVAVNMVEQHRTVALANVGFPGTQMPREESFCGHTVTAGERIEVPDLSVDPRFADNPYVAGPAHVRFYAGEPVAAPNGEPIGTLCILDFEPRRLDDEQVRMLRILADWVEKDIADDEDSARAREVQRRLLPRHALDIPGYDLTGRSVPARRVGGDYFDWQQLGDGTVQVVMADVMGKGLTAAVLAAGLRSSIRGASGAHSIDLAVTRAAASLEEDLEDAASFVTLFAIRLDPGTGDLRWVDGGHGLAVIVRTDGTADRLTSTDLPLGVVAGETWQAHAARLDPGDALVVVSDGVLDRFPDETEALASGTSTFGPVTHAQALVDAVALLPEDDAPEDDLTIVVLRRKRPQVS